MTSEFQKGLITGLAMQPLQVTTEHSTDDPTQESTDFICAFAQVGGIIPMFQAIGESETTE